MRELILNDNQITDEGLIYFATNGTKFTALKHFGLSSNKITDQGLNAIASNASKFNKLKALYLEDTQITSKGVEKVMKKFKLNFEIFTWGKEVIDKRWILFPFYRLFLYKSI